MTETEAEMNCSPLRIFLTEEEMASFDKEQLIGQWCRQESYINWLESQLSGNPACVTLRFIHVISHFS